MCPAAESPSGQTEPPFRDHPGGNSMTLSDHIDTALPNEVGPALKLPLILSGLESAFLTGKPFLVAR